MNENTNNTNLNNNKTSAATTNTTIEDSPIKLHVLKTTGKTQDIAVMQVPNPLFGSTISSTGTENDPCLNILIDCGSEASANGHLAIIKNTLKIEKIHYIYITHYHLDHTGGMPTLASGLNMNNAEIFLPEHPLNGYTGDGVLTGVNSIYASAETNEMKVRIPGGNVGKIEKDENSGYIFTKNSNDPETGKTEFNIGDLKLEFKNYDTSIYYDSSECKDYNNTCLCCIMSYGKTRIGFFGDIGLEAQENLTNTIGHLDLMNIEHHGVNSGHYRPFYDSISPKMCFTQDGKGFHYDDKNKVWDWHILSEHSKSHAYLQENNIPNYAVSVNGTITFDIYKCGISTTANAVKYAINVKGISSFMGAINNTVSPGKSSNIDLATLLKNMEHGTFLSTMVEKGDSSNGTKLWQDTVKAFVDDNVTISEMILYKGGSSKYNRSMETKSNAGYIILIPHTIDSSIGPIIGYWYAIKPNNKLEIKVVLKQCDVSKKVINSYTIDDIDDAFPSYNAYPTF